MRLITGTKHAEHIGYFVVREQEGTAEIEVQDAEAMETREEAEAWIEANGIVGVDYWICAPVTRTSVAMVAIADRIEADRKLVQGEAAKLDGGFHDAYAEGFDAGRQQADKGQRAKGK